MSEQPQQDPLMLMRTIWGAFIFSIFVYSFIIYQQFGDFLLTDFPVMDSRFAMFSGLAVGCLFLSYILPQRIFAAADQAKPLDGSLSPEEQHKLQVQKQLVPFVVKIALQESVVIMGLVLSFSVKQNLMLPYAFIAIAALLSSFPRRPVIANRG